jgi:hypothetical protein
MATRPWNEPHLLIFDRKLSVTKLCGCAADIERAAMVEDEINTFMAILI